MNWKEVAGYEGIYEVSSDGHVRSIARPGVRNSRLLKGAIGSNGYRTVTLSGKTHAVHTLVAAAFHGPRPLGLHINHCNADKTDNRAQNLEYCTPSENRAHSFAMGMESTAGDNSRVRKLDSAAVSEIRALRRGGMMQKEIAPLFGIAQSAVSMICSGKRWASTL